jgi:hypothetical protein
MTEKITMKKAILHHCHECLGYYIDGKVDCENVKCPLYAFMPYRKLEPDVSFLLYNPRSVGLKLKTDTARPMTEEQRQKAAERLSAARKNKS